MSTGPAMPFRICPTVRIETRPKGLFSGCRAQITAIEE
jgi:hypothetical protein